MTSTLHLVGEGFVQSLFRMGEMFAQTRSRQAHVPPRRAGREPPRRVRRHAHEVRDGDASPSAATRSTRYLDRMEGMLGAGSTQAGLTGGGETTEALAILLGGGTSEAQLGEGYGKLLAIRKRQVNEYMHRLEVVGLGDRRQQMNPFMALLLDPPKN